jgi:hypothetical protein
MRKKQKQEEKWLTHCKSNFNDYNKLSDNSCFLKFRLEYLGNGGLKTQQTYWSISLKMS